MSIGIANQKETREILEEAIQIETHLHDREKWFGAAAVAVGETHVADRVGGTTTAFALVSGNSDFNATWTQIFGSSDTPVEAGKTLFDAHRYLVTATDSTSIFIVQLVAGESADIAAKILVEEFTEIMYISASNNNDSGIEEIMSLRIPVGTKIWARCACVGQDAKTINFYDAIHEYDE